MYINTCMVIDLFGTSACFFPLKVRHINITTNKCDVTNRHVVVSFFFFRINTYFCRASFKYYVRTVDYVRSLELWSFRLTSRRRDSWSPRRDAWSPLHKSTRARSTFFFRQYDESRSIDLHLTPLSGLSSRDETQRKTDGEDDGLGIGRDRRGVQNERSYATTRIVCYD